MRKVGAAALVALLTAGATPPPTPAEAFACNLPYPAAMQAMGELKVLGQKSGTSLFTFTPMTTVTFDAKSVTLFGATPSALTLELTEPKAKDPRSKMRADFIAMFAPSQSVDDLITKSYTWHFNVCKHLSLCIRSSDSGKPGWLELQRETGGLKLLCRHEMTMAELEKL